MDINIGEIVTLVVTAVTSGSLSWIFTLKYTRKQAEGDAMRSVQGVYQSLIEDLKHDREELREENNGMRERFTELETQISQLKKEVESNRRLVRSLQPYICYRAACQDRMKSQK